MANENKIGCCFAELFSAAATSWDYDRERHALHFRVDRDAHA
jgi:hypothetical protein